MLKQVEIFCRQVRARSDEHRQAIRALARYDLSGQVVSILRQELDSLIRVIFLLAQRDHDYRNQLIEAAVSGKEWTAKDSHKRVTDREMVELARSLHGWTECVYKFGCAFIHLSGMHDYKTRDALQRLPANERQDMISYLRSYHGGPLEPSPSFDDVIPLLPWVFEKISSNLECYLEDLEKGRILDEEDEED